MCSGLPSKVALGLIRTLLVAEVGIEPTMGEFMRLITLPSVVSAINYYTLADEGFEITFKMIYPLGLLASRHI